MSTGWLSPLQLLNQADPVPLCGDIIVDVDGQIYRRCPVPRKAVSRAEKGLPPGTRGHPNLPFTHTRLTLSELARRT